MVRIADPIKHFIWVVALVVLLPLAAALAQDNGEGEVGFIPDSGLPGLDTVNIGVIPGTDITRDEFRARAMAQLKAIAICAHTYYLLHDKSFPDNFNQLKKSESWNLQVNNLFTGMQMHAIYFDPGPEDMTHRPVMDVPISIDPLPPVVTGQDEQGNFDPEAFGESLSQSLGRADQSILRVDPTRIHTFRGGDLYYYTNGTILQLVLFAPDGTYLEHVNLAPDEYWVASLKMTSIFWPDSAQACQVLLYLTEVMPDLYNLVRFMGDQEPLAVETLQQLPAGELVDMAAELDIVVANPFSGQPISLSGDYSLGNFYQSSAENRPCRIWMPDKLAYSLADFRAFQQASGDEQQTLAPAAEPQSDSGRQPVKRPPLGGK